MRRATTLPDTTTICCDPTDLTQKAGFANLPPAKTLDFETMFHSSTEKRDQSDRRNDSKRRSTARRSGPRRIEKTTRPSERRESPDRRADAGRSDGARRRQARRAKDSGGVACDADEAIKGRLEVLTATRDEDEVRVYVDTLAEECDRFEYALTGEDIE